MRDSVFDVLLCGEMREESGRLEEVAETAFCGGRTNFRAGIEKSFAINRDTSFVRRDEAGNAIEERGFSCAGWTEKNCEARRKREIDIEVKRVSCESRTMDWTWS